MKNWVTKPIKDVVIDLHQGLNTAGYKIKFYDSGYPIIQTRNLENGVIDLDEKMKFMSKSDWLIYKDKYKPNIGDVFLTNIGTIGKTAVVTEEQDYLIHWNIFIFKVDKKIIDPYYLKTFLDTPFCFDYYQSCQKGGTVNFITKKMIEVLEIPLPPLPEQQRIVTILDEAFAAIAKAKANAEQNLKNAKELFESYLQGVFENKGEGWEEKTLGEVTNIQRGSSPRPKGDPRYFSATKTDFNWITISDISSYCEDKILLQTREWLTEEGSKQSRFVDKNEFIIAVSGSTTGKCCITGIKGFIYDGLAVVKIIDNKIEPKFLLSYMMSLYSFINNSKAGAAFPNINTEYLKNLPFSYPPLKGQQTIVQKLDALSVETKKLEAIYQQKINDLEELKKSVLQ